MGCSTERRGFVVESKKSDEAGTQKQRMGDHGSRKGEGATGICSAGSRQALLRACRGSLPRASGSVILVESTKDPPIAYLRKRIRLETVDSQRLNRFPRKIRLKTQ